MKTYKKTLFALMALGLIMTINSCTKEDPSNPGSGGGDNDLPLELAQSDFQQDIVLKDRKDGVDYIINSSLVVGIDIEIEPGVTVEFEEGAGIDITDDGSLSALGSESKPITFTSEIKTNGGWQGILIESRSLKNQFQYCIFEYGGGEEWGNGIQGGLTMWSQASINIDNCTFRNNKKYGFQGYNDRESELRSFENNSFENNEFSMNVSPYYTHEVGRNNSFVGNNPMIDVYSNHVFENEVSQSKTWKAHQVPYRILGRVNVTGDNNLTFEEGTDIVFTETSYFDVKSDASLTAVGTMTNRITMSGEGSGVGIWPGLSFESSKSNRNKLEYVDISGAGSGQEGFVQGAIYMWANPRLQVSNCNFTDIQSCVFYQASGGEFNPELTVESILLNNAGVENCN